MILFIVVLLIFAIFIYVMCPLLAYERLVLGRKDPDAMHRSSNRIIRHVLNLILTVCRIHPTVIGKENLISDGPAVYVANHRSYFDILLLYTLIPGQVSPIAKKELARIPLLGLWIDSLGGFLLDRENPRQGMQVILSATEELKKGVSVMVFPEGTRFKGEEGDMMEFKEGTFKMALKTGVPVVPIALAHTADLFENHLPCIRPVPVTITVGKPIETASLSRAQQKEVPAMAEKAVREMLTASLK